MSNVLGSAANDERYLSEFEMKLLKCVSWSIILMDREAALELLGLPECYTEEELKRSYRKACLLHHPDKAYGKCAEESAFHKVQEAYAMLREEEKGSKVEDSHDADLINFLLWFLFKVCRRSSSLPPKEILVEVTLREVYDAAVKKLVYRRVSKGEVISETLFLELIDFRERYVIPGKGDEDAPLVIRTNLLKAEEYYLDNLLSTHDLYLRRQVSVFEHYYGLLTPLMLPNGESLPTVQQRLPPVEVWSDRGLPYEDDLGIRKRGTLYVIYEVDMRLHSLREEDGPVLRRMFHSQNIAE